MWQRPAVSVLALVVVGVGLLVSGDDIGAAPGDHLWSKRFGDVNEQHAQSVAVDPASSVLLTGYFAGAADFGGGPLVSAGTEAPDIFLAKFGPNGDHSWSKRFGDGSWQDALSVASDAAGNVIITGFFDGSVDFGGEPHTATGASDIFVAKFDSNGNLSWSKGFGDSGIQSGTSVTTDQSGNVLVAGTFEGTVNFGGESLTSSDGAFLAKFDADGSHLWSRGFSYANGDPSVATDQDDNVFVAGSFQGSIDFGAPTGPLLGNGGSDVFLAKFAPSGDHLWSKRFGDANDQEARTVTTDHVGNVVIAGRFRGSVDFGGTTLVGGSTYMEVFLAKFSTTGDHIWSKGFGDANHEHDARTVSVDGVGNVFVSGYFDGTMDFGGSQLTSAAGYDIFLAAFDRDGGHIWSNDSVTPTTSMHGVPQWMALATFSLPDTTPDP